MPAHPCPSALTCLAHPCPRARTCLSPSSPRTCLAHPCPCTLTSLAPSSPCTRTCLAHRGLGRSPDVNYEELARCTDDFNGAQCKAVCVEAVRARMVSPALSDCRGARVCSCSWERTRWYTHAFSLSLSHTHTHTHTLLVQGMIALRREATEVKHEDYMDGSLFPCRRVPARVPVPVCVVTVTASVRRQCHSALSQWPLITTRVPISSQCPLCSHSRGASEEEEGAPLLRLVSPGLGLRVGVRAAR